MVRNHWFAFLTVFIFAGCPTKSDSSQTPVHKAANKQPGLHLVTMPVGFKIAPFATGLEDARSMARGDKGTIFVGSRKRNKVYALVDVDGDNKADKTYTLASGLNMPNGIAFLNGSLYVAEVHRIIRFDKIEDNLANPPSPSIVYDKLPTELHHGWRYIGFGPDGFLYCGSGAPCNVCERKDDERFASILRMKPDGSEIEVFAHGVRNTVGFDFDPNTKDLWFTENGRDMMGDDIPPDELNHTSKKGMHFGFPYCHGGNISDPEFGVTRLCGEFTKPAQNLGAHVAALGMRFYTGSMFPKSYQNQIFIAEHGSWNRSKKSGYQISLIKLENQKVVSYEPFAQGFKQGEEAWGRPVDLLVLADGSLLVSDDLSGAVYRISYEAPTP